MAQVIYGGTSSALVYEPMSDVLGDYISRANKRTMDMLGDFSRGFRDKAREISSRLRFDEILSIRDKADRLHQALYLEDDIRPLIGLDAILLAKPKMRRYLMAEPTVRQMYRDKKLSGWDNEVSDDISRDVHDIAEYKHAIHGMLNDDVVTEYYDLDTERLREDEPLSFRDQVDIAITWEQTRRIIDVDKLDPTSKWGATLD